MKKTYKQLAAGLHLSLPQMRRRAQKVLGVDDEAGLADGITRMLDETESFILTLAKRIEDEFGRCDICRGRENMPGKLSTFWTSGGSGQKGRRRRTSLISMSISTQAGPTLCGNMIFGRPLVRWIGKNFPAPSSRNSMNTIFPNPPCTSTPCQVRSL